jgi:hypothetical protein
LTAENTALAPLKAYWQPGCTSCLRMKEFLTLHGVPFVSVIVAHGTGGAQKHLLGQWPGAEIRHG